LKGFAGGLFMQQRQPRVGDIVDDYCPRERRLSDHAVVAMVGHEIRQTRCTTCDTEHEYREGKVPAARKKAPPPLPPKPAGAAGAILAAPKPIDPDAAGAGPGDETSTARAGAVPAAGEPARPEVGAEPPAAAHEGPVHRRLIRAVLPRIEGEIPARQAPEFTMHTANQRPAHGRPVRGKAGGHSRPGGKPATGHHAGGFGARAHGAHGAQGGHGAHGRGRPAQGGGHAHGGPRPGRSHGGGHGRKKP
jgi:hypothetical protein